MSLERVIKVIMDLGLSETDAQVYVFLALNGPHEAKQIIKKMNLYKRKLYRSLKNLKDKDVVKSTFDYPAVFYAISFEEILDLLSKIKKEQAQVLQETKDELLTTWKTLLKKKSNNN